MLTDLKVMFLLALMIGDVNTINCIIFPTSDNVLLGRMTNASDQATVQ